MPDCPRPASPGSLAFGLILLLREQPALDAAGVTDDAAARGVFDRWCPV